MRVALATAAHLPNGSDDDQVLIAAMREQGLQPLSVIWDAAVDWRQFDVVVLRSIWDYHLKYARFLEWLNALDAARVPVHNSTALARWNADKQYLFELEQRGVRITPSRLATATNGATLAGLQAETGWQRVVIKPTVASTGYETWLLDAAQTAEAESRFTQQKMRMDLLVQEFVEGVQAGEVSLVFLPGGYSHSVVKRAAGTEFRVHTDHGGTVESFQPPAGLIAWAENVIAAIGQPWTYARVDVVSDAAGPMLMELELLDPELFFQYQPSAAHVLIAGIQAQQHAR